MPDTFPSKILLIFALSISLGLPGCLGQKQAVDPYRDRPPSQTMRLDQSASKSLPAVSSVQPQAANSMPARYHVTPADGQNMASGELLPVMTLVADRIVAYEDKLGAWDSFTAEADQVSLDDAYRERIRTCRERLQEVLSGYNRLHEELIVISGATEVEAGTMERVYEVELADMMFLESECQQILSGSGQAGAWLIGTRKKIIEENERSIVEAMDASDYPRVISLYEEMPPEQAAELSYESVYSYGLALLKNGSEREASDVFRQLLNRVQGQNRVNREFQLMQLIADIAFGLEDYPVAFNGYVSIINRYAGFGDNVEWARKQQQVISSREVRGVEVGSFAELLRAYLVYNPDRDGFRVVTMARRFVESFPESPVYPTANRILFESQDRADAWFAGLIQRVDLLANDKQYAEALQLIETLPVMDMPDDKRDQIRNRTDELITARFQEAEIKRLALQASLQETWNEGQELLRDRRYDDAIAVFTALLETEYAERAQAQIDEAADLAAQEDRRRAAELFVRSTTAQDLDTRVRLLFESRQLLMNILVKYPGSAVTEKAGKNLERIEQEIMSIDPQLLENPPQTGIAPATKPEPQVQPQQAGAMYFGELQVQSSPPETTLPANEDAVRPDPPITGEKE